MRILGIENENAFNIDAHCSVTKAEVVAMAEYLRRAPGTTFVIFDGLAQDDDGKIKEFEFRVPICSATSPDEVIGLIDKNLGPRTIVGGVGFGWGHFSHLGGWRLHARKPRKGAA